MGRKGERKAPSRAQDAARVARTKLDQIPAGLWRTLRLRADLEVREVVDAMVAAGNLSLTDLRDLELWQAVEGLQIERQARKRYDDERKRVEKGGEPDYTAPGLNAIANLRASALQSRKALRTVLLAMGPQLTANDQPVRLPVGMTEPEMRARVAGLDDDEIVN